MACSAGVRSVAKGLGFKRLVYDFAAKWMSGDVKTRKEFDEMLKKAGLGIEDVTAEALSSKVNSLDALTAYLRARRRVATTPCARLIVSARRSAPQCGKRSMKSRMWSFETSKPAK